MRQFVQKQIRIILYAFLGAAGILAAAYPSVAVQASAVDRSDVPTPVVSIVAKRFEFIPNQITLKRGEPVTLHLTSEDVTHGFYLKALHIDEVIEPGKFVDVTVTPQVAGSFVTICHHFCGANHGNMKMTITVE